MIMKDKQNVRNKKLKERQRKSEIDEVRKKKRTGNGMSIE